MMSAHGTNPIFLNKKKKIERLEHSLTPHPLRPKTSYFALTFHPPTPSATLLRWTSYVYHPVFPD